MDDRRFDDVTRRYGHLLNRRAMLASAAAATVAGIASVDGAGARRTCRTLGASCLRNRDCCSVTCEILRSAPRNRRNRCVCPGDLIACGSTCIDGMSDPANCGGCGIVCESGECVDGACAPPAGPCVGGVDLGGSCEKAVDCCSLVCDNGTCVAGAIDCQSYNGYFVPEPSLCYRTKGEAFGALMTAASDFYCQGSSPSPQSYPTLSPCTTNEECQGYADTDGLANARGVCLDQLVVCNGNDKCNLVVGTQISSMCAFLFTAGSVCPEN
jgi:hypothetical protein